MGKELRYSRIIQILIITICLIMVVCIWPMGLFQREITSRVQTESYMETETAKQDNDSVMQEFIPTQEYLHSITVMVDSLGGSTGLFKLHLYDAALNLMWEDGKRFDESPGIAEYTFHVDQKVVVGQPYYYTLDYASASFAACYTEKDPTEQNDNGDNGKLYFNLQEIADSNLITQYQYQIPFGPKRIAVFSALILLAGLCVCVGITLGEKKRSLLWNKKVTADRTFHIFAITYLSMAALYILYQVLSEHLFSAYMPENIVLSAGVLLSAMVIGYGITRISIEKFYGILRGKNHNQSIETNKKTNKETNKETNKQTIKGELLHRLPGYLQILFWGMAILACVDFVNAGSNYAQGLAIREMCIYFALAAITMFTRRELINLWNGIYVITACIMVFLYARSFAGQGEPFQTAVRTALMWAFAGLIFISTGYNLAHRKIAKFSLPFAGAVTLFFALLLIFRNGNIWEVAVVVPFTLFYIRQKSASQMDKILGNIANGVVFSFVITTIEALLHRPYHYYTMVRYSGVFMTVTVTAVYLGMVFAVALCKFLTKYEKSRKLSNVWKELLLMGLACGYEFLSLSRTGMVSCGVVYAATCVIYVICNRNSNNNNKNNNKNNSENKKYSSRIFQPLRFILYTILAVIVCIPITYTASRTIPALVNKPTIYMGEEFQDSIRQGEPVDSFRYITIEKVLGVSNERMLGKTDLNFVTQSGKTVEEVLEEAKQQEDVLAENGVSVEGDQVTYVDDYGDAYTIDNPDYSNGRMETYRTYLQYLNLTGHPAIGLETEDGQSFVHAHNSFLQMAYDCGIVTGVVFLLLYVILGFRSIWYYCKRKESDRYALLPLVIFATFGISSMVEYVFRPTIPLGFVFLLMIAPLIMASDGNENKTDAELE